MPAVAQNIDSPLDSIRQLIRSRQLIVTLTSRDLKARYRGSILGYFWSLANPLLLLAVYTIVFTKFFPRPDVQPYSVFMFTGILPWTFFAGAVLESTNVLIANGGLIKKVTFPTEVLPIVVVVSHFVHFLFALPILFVALAIGIVFAGVPLGWPVLLAPAIMVVQALFVAGVTLMISSAAVLFRDLKDIVANLLNLGFFLTPIIYSLESSFITDTVAGLLRINPMTSYVIGFQDVFFFSRIPSTIDIALMLGWAFAAVWFGLVVFDRLRDTLAEAI
ncbi:MAG: ABC transporter permease [Thermoanaerobaculia bacterium]|nr:ABC transporter permease [Thermoanaerobaculia bacterium]